ncbi:MAG: hypothetical protein ABSE18_04505 [Minisyncoccia bacterium]
MEPIKCGECGKEIPYLSENCPFCGKVIATIASDHKPKLGKKVLQAGMEIAGGAIPVIGGIFSAAASAWEGHDQERANAFFKHWLRMLFDEMREKEQTIVEIMARLDMHDAKIGERMKSPEYQSIVKKAFREWSGAESEEKRKLIRNILSNAAATALVSDDVIKLFLDWLKNYSELHFKVIGVIYNKNGITRGEVWRQLGKQPVREDSPEADLFKLLFRDLSTGAIIRQHKDRDYAGNIIVSRATGRTPKSSGTHTAKSAFDEEEQYELTGIGQQFVHYAMTELSLKIEAPKNSPIG